MKPSIRKQDGQWLVTRPGYGFNPVPAVVEFGSWKAAVASLTSGTASASSVVERAADLSHLYWGPPRGTIRLEET